MSGPLAPPRWLDLHLVESAMKDGIWVIDSEARTVYANPPMAEMLGCGLDALIGRTLFEFMDPENVETARANIDRRRAGIAEEHAFVFRRADGGRLFTRLSAAPALAADGTYLGAVAIVVDVTAQQESERARRQSEARIETVFRSLPFDCWVMDKNGRYERQNVTSIQHWGDQVGRSPIDGTLSEPVRAKWIESNARALSGEIVRERREYVHGGERRTFDAVIAPVRDGDVIDGILGVNIDVTEQVRLERRLREAEKLEAIGRLAGGIAHDFNNLLMAVLSSCALLERRLTDSQDRADLQIIRESAARGGELTRQLLTFARRESVAPETVRPADVTARMGMMLRRLLGDDVELVIDTGGSRASVCADPVGLERTIVNLAANAREAMPSGGKLTLRVTDQTVAVAMPAVDSEIAPGPYVVITIEDTGVGMDEATVAHIFEPFFTTRGSGGGSGLGLASFYGFVRQANGHIVVHTNPGVGTRFDIYLPQVSGEPVSDQARPAESRAPGGGARILVVEDDELVRRLLVRVLRDEGYDVTQAATPSAAAEAIARGAPFQLLLSDVSMPEGGGLALFDRLTRDGLRCPVLFISGYAHSAEVHARVDASRIQFLQKPFLPDVLLATVRRLLQP